MLEVMQAGNRRIVVLTETHVALMRVRPVAAVRSVYRAMWKVRLTKIQTVRGAAPPWCLSHGLPGLCATSRSWHLRAGPENKWMGLKSGGRLLVPQWDCAIIMGSLAP